MDSLAEQHSDSDIDARDQMWEKYQVFLKIPQLHNINIQYYLRYIHKVPCFTSKYTGYMWMCEILESDSDVRCMNAFRMECHVFRVLCSELEVRFGFRRSKNMTTIEKLGIFLYTIALGMSNRAVCERFQRSGGTISSVFHEVLETVVGRSRNYHGFVRDLLQPRDKNFTTIPAKIQSQDRYKVFKGAIGCIDGVHMDASIPVELQQPYFGRKKYCTFNVMAVCDFDMYFTFISTGWEGSAHDAKVFDHAIKTLSLNFPHPPPERYYLVDKGYPDRQGYMVPYSKVNYHRNDFGKEAPRNQREGFNRIHSSLRGTIERCFGVMKKRWKILKTMPSYTIETQVDIIIACFGLHNFLLKHRLNDSSFEDDDVEEEPVYNPSEEGFDNHHRGMKAIRDGIAHEIWKNKRVWL